MISGPQLFFKNYPRLARCLTPQHIGSTCSSSLVTSYPVRCSLARMGTDGMLLTPVGRILPGNNTCQSPFEF